MNLEDIVRRYVEENYDLIDARSKAAQDIILSKISKSKFKNHFGNIIVADMFESKKGEGKLPAISVSGPYGAVKEQCSGLLQWKGLTSLFFILYKCYTCFKNILK